MKAIKMLDTEYKMPCYSCHPYMKKGITFTEFYYYYYYSYRKDVRELHFIIRMTWGFVLSAVSLSMHHGCTNKLKQPLLLYLNYEQMSMPYPHYNRETAPKCVYILFVFHMNMYYKLVSLHEFLTTLLLKGACLRKAKRSLARVMKLCHI